MLGAAPETRLPAEAYTPEITRQVYDALQTRARAALDAGYTAIIDAVSLISEERQAFAEVARQAGVPFTGLWLEAEPEVMSGRIGERRGDASDATADVLAVQLRQDPGLIDGTVSTPSWSGRMRGRSAARVGCGLRGLPRAAARDVHHACQAE